MRVLWRRPLASGAVCFSLVLCVLLRVGKPVRLTVLGIACVLFAAVCLYALWKRNMRRCLLPLLCILGLLLGSLCAHWFVEWRYAPVKELSGKTVSAEGFVIEREASTSYSSLMRVQLESLDGRKASLQATVTFEYASALQAGDVFRLEGIVCPFDEEQEFDEEQYWLSEGCLLKLRVPEEGACERIGEKDHHPRVLLAHWNEVMSSRLYHAVGKEEGGLAVALLLGNRSYLAPETTLAFERTGTTHLLALSGLHVSVLVGFLELVLRWLRMKKKARLVLIMTSVVLYTGLTGFAMSMVRAAIMMLLVGAAFYAAEEYDAFTALTVALAGILGLMPYAVYDLSLWMSFLSAGAIIVFIPLWEWIQEMLYNRLRWKKRWIKLLASVLSGLFVGIAANLSLMLLSVSVFGSVSVLSVPATILLIPPTSLLLILSIPALLFSSCPVLTFLPRLLSDVTVRATEWLASADGILFYMDSVPILAVLFILTGMLILLALLYVPNKRAWLFALPLLLAILAFFMSGFGVGFPGDQLEVRLADASGGEVMLMSENGRTVAIDASDGSAVGAILLVKMANASGCTEIDDLIITRYFNKNNYFLAELLSEIRVDRVRLPMPQTRAEEAMAKRLCEEVKPYGTEIVWDLDGLAIEDLACTTFLSASATGSVGSRVLLSFVYGEERITYLTGAILGEPGLSIEASACCLVSDWLILGQRATGDRTPYSSKDTCTVYLPDATLKYKLPPNLQDTVEFYRDAILQFSIS